MTQEDKEELRYQVRAHLADRAAVAQTVPTIHRTVQREVACSCNDVLEACVFLLGLGQLVTRVATLGSTESYQISSLGMLEAERGG